MYPSLTCPFARARVTPGLRLIVHRNPGTVISADPSAGKVRLAEPAVGEQLDAPFTSQGWVVTGTLVQPAGPGTGLPSGPGQQNVTVACETSHAPWGTVPFVTITVYSTIVPFGTLAGVTSILMCNRFALQPGGLCAGAAAALRKTALALTRAPTNTPRLVPLRHAATRVGFLPHISSSLFLTHPRSLALPHWATENDSTVTPQMEWTCIGRAARGAMTARHAPQSQYLMHTLTPAVAEA